MNLKLIRAATAVFMLGAAASAMAQYTALAIHEKGYGEGAGQTQVAAEAAAKAACEAKVKSKGCNIQYTAVAIRYHSRDIPYTWKIGFNSFQQTNDEIINHCHGLGKKCLTHVLFAPGFFAIAQAEKTENAALVSEGVHQFLSLEKAKGVAKATCEAKAAGRQCEVIAFGAMKGVLRSEANREAPQKEEMPFTRLTEEQAEKHLEADFKKGILKCEHDPYTSPLTRHQRLIPSALWPLGCKYVE